MAAPFCSSIVRVSTAKDHWLMRQYVGAEMHWDSKCSCSRRAGATYRGRLTTVTLPSYDFAQMKPGEAMMKLPYRRGLTELALAHAGALEDECYQLGRQLLPGGMARPGQLLLRG